MDDEESIGVFYDLIDYLLRVLDDLAATRAELDEVKKELANVNPWYPRDPTWKPAPGWFDEGWADPMDDNLPPPT